MKSTGEHSDRARNRLRRFHAAGDPEFRLGSVLATSFTGTQSVRFGDAVEQIPTPQRLVDLLAVYELPV